MALIFPSNSAVYSSSSNTKFYVSSSQNSNPDFNFNFNLLKTKKIPSLTSKSKINNSPIQTPQKPLNFFTCRDGMNSSNVEEERIDMDYDYDAENLESPWEGAVIYKRNPSITHLEYCTTLERLGFGEVSSDVSKSMASKMGLRVTKSVKDFPFGTPVQISIDVTRKKHRLRLDGVIKTVLGLSCNRCGGPAAEGVFSNFTLLLDEEPIEEPEVIDMGVIFGEEKSSKTSSSLNEGEADDYEDSLIDLDDRLYFPPEDREIDISKNIRDLVHIEITINAICDTNCKGICLKCGTNLNLGSCNCNRKEEKKVNYGPLGDLRKQMQQK
ncbi:hypothetical protein C5167_023559 [Papaver somniferum]|uniref:Large ribosomal RNA subunit accumulation protein YCED homolog 1, chloroplastic n=1 Tax=Papaver somniferum TaxID=3469 RepID=A0A4Y7JP30_PAPSO|nr:large ribosomal RNA subunit accumulation protein YCED homolog 1, chloroplastic-like [Papaver somniferum]RZC61782.1 hypothetical protein C5167_023559 [Papaver somniferum]